MQNSHTKSLLIVISAPSGAGKTTLCDRLLTERGDIVYSVSCTTRDQRGEEKHGVDYFFLSDEEFRRRLQSGEFLEYAEVHNYMYGTLRASVADGLRAGKGVLMDIDVQGAEQVRECVRSSAAGDVLRAGFVDIFVAPPSLAELRDRLEGRKEDSAEVIQRRLDNAAAELERANEYMYVVVNDDLDTAYAELVRILDREAGKHE